jgi:gliding motility-associated-like protein
MYNTSATGCRSATASQLITVNPTPKPDFNFPDSLCLPSANVIFNNLSSISDGSENAFVYLWNFGDPVSGTLNSSVGKDPVHRYGGAGPYNVRLQVTSGGGCVKDTTMVVNTIHPQPKADFSVTRPAICIGDTVTFEDKSNGRDGTINKWNWSFDDGSSSVVEDPSHQYTAAKTYKVSLYITNSLGCNSDTVIKPFNVYAFPLVDAGPDKIVLTGGSVLLDPTITGLDNQYLWEPATYLDNSRLARPTSTPVQDITYKITVSNPGGCSASDDVFIQIKQGPNIPNTFSPNGDGINEKWIIEYLSTYPNCRVKVFTRQGQLVFESQGYKVPWNGTMNGKALPVDTYYYIIEPENGRKPLTGYVTIVK